MLIGMPSSGKSAVGFLLAKLMGYGFIDSDRVIEGLEEKSLSELIAENGTDGFLKIEERVNCGLDVSRCVIATGGSAVYSDRAMESLRRKGTIVYLKTDEQTIRDRIPDFVSRGVVMRGEITSLGDLYRERAPLYERYADFAVDCAYKSAEDVASEIAAAAERIMKK